MLEEQVKATLKDAAKKLTGSKKRAFMAQVGRGLKTPDFGSHFQHKLDHRR